MKTEPRRPETVRLRVFCSEGPRSGNPLAILSGTFDAPRQVASEVLAFEGLNQVVLLSNGAQVGLRIYTPKTELPFSGQPVLGALHLLRMQGRPMLIETGVGQVRGRHAEALDWLEARAEWSPPMHIKQLATSAAIEALTGAPKGIGYYYAWAWIDEAIGSVRARMFAPALGITEGQASGAAVVRLATEINRDLIVRQGRDSVLHARLADAGAVWLGGRCIMDASKPG